MFSRRSTDPQPQVVDRDDDITYRSELAVRSLCDLHALGTHFLLNRPIVRLPKGATDALWSQQRAQIARLVHDARTWETLVLRALGHLRIPTAEVYHFEVLQDLTPIEGGAVNDEHQACLNDVNGKLTVLREITQRHEEGRPRW